MKRLIFYDLDGTLVDTLQDIADAANHMLVRLGLPPREPTDIRGAIGSGVQELVRRCLRTDDPARIDQGVALYRAYYTQHLLDHSRLYPGAQKLLDHFKDRRQAVITNKPNPYSTDILRSLGVAGYFCEIIGGNSGYPAKPDPAALLAVMGREGVAAEQAVLIGDSPIDIETGRRAGALTVTLTHGFSTAAEIRGASPDVLVDSFDELLILVTAQRW